MTPEEFQRIKEAEKKHLRELNKLKKMAKRLQRQKKVNKALSDLVAGREDVLSAHDRAMEKVERETALGEARLDIALEQAQAAASDDAALEDDFQKVRARELLRQMKLVSGMQQTPVNKTEVPKHKTPAKETSKKPAAPKAEDAEAPEKPPGKLPDKTIGRMKP